MAHSSVPKCGWYSRGTENVTLLRSMERVGIYNGQSRPKFSNTHFLELGLQRLREENLELLYCWSVSCVISNFSREADDNRTILGYYAASSNNFLPTFRD